MLTKWGKALDRTKIPHPEYPRPQMVRKNWVNLNGEWSLNIIKKGANSDPKVGKILVPFPIESQLSGAKRRVEPTDTVTYIREFDVPKGERILLHFGACDWHTIVYVNGYIAGEHKGGYDAFSFDITPHLRTAGKQHLTVEVKDPTDASTQPRGKQVLKPEGIWYTPTSGIWQTVWLEAVPKTYIEGLKIEGKVDGTVTISPVVRGDERSGLSVTAELTGGATKLAGEMDLSRASLALKVTNPRLWSPDDAFLYNLKVKLVNSSGKVIDEVASYVGLREISLKPDANGQPRVNLNGKPIFLIGPLDQGFWPDGLYTAPSDEALRYDLEVTKRLGFNFIRKHVKVEPQRWYYHCDKMGLLVMQDLPSGDRYIGGSDPDIQRTPESQEILRRELKAMVETHRNHPSIISWVLYNEGWGQYDTANMTRWLTDLDKTRLINSVSGWTDRNVGHFWDVHVYPGPGAPPPDKNRAVFLGEFGGLGLPVEGHTWQKEGWGYQSFKTKEELTDAFVGLLEDLRFLIDKPGLSGAVYTQTTDVETEINGLMTYDRELIKMDETRVREAVLALFKPAPSLTTVVPTAETGENPWRYTFERPLDGWQASSFDAAGWKQGAGGFGIPETPSLIIKTRWDTADIWLRREVEFDRDYSAEELRLRMHHDDNVEVFLDGKLLVGRGGWTSAYKLFRLPEGAYLKGKHTLAIHCHQNTGGQYIDAGFVSVKGG
jgi:hypothetical protein